MRAALREPTLRVPSFRIPTVRLDTLRRHRIQALCLAVVIVDQATKAVQPTGAFIVNTGGAALVPSAVGDALWASPALGAACDTLDTILLLVALNVIRRLSNARTQAGVTAVLAGLLSNLADRLGASSLFHTGLPRGTIDWIPVPLWPSARANLADVVIALGALVLGFSVLRTAVLAVRSLTRRSRIARLAAATAAVVVLAGWTTFWQVNRQAAVPPSPPSLAFRVAQQQAADHQHDREDDDELGHVRL